MRLRQLLERQDDIAQNLATDYSDPRTGLIIPSDVANSPVFIKNPKHGIVGLTNQNLDGHDATALQRWLNTFGYKLDTDGMLGPATYKALDDLFSRARDGDIQDSVISTTTGTVGVDPETGELVTYGVDDIETPQSTNDKYTVMPNGDVVWPDGTVSPSIKSTPKKPEPKSNSTAYYLDKDGNLVKK